MLKYQSGSSLVYEYHIAGMARQGAGAAQSWTAGAFVQFFQVR